MMFISIFGYTQEDCTNGIDDDGDGLIDLQDGGDCFCGDIMWSEVIGDFEDYTCCPTMFTSLPNEGIFCLDDGWAPPNAGTSDYFNTCNYVGGGALPFIPMPIPSGEGAVGFISQDGYYENVGVCMDKTMISGETYNLSFYIGFNAEAGWGSDLDVTINIYGTEDCDNFPLDTGFEALCISSYDEWDLIAGIPVSGVENDSWLFVSTTFIANMNAEAIAFGLECGVSSSQYHFLDDININGNFLVPTTEEDLVSSGNCIDGVTVELPNSTGTEFQWFLDGVAIPGATTNPYLITDASAEGEYQLMVINGGICSITNSIDIEIDADAIEIDGVVSDIQCILNNDGMIDISTNSPNDPYIFEWSNGDMTEDVEGVGPGMYIVTVTDDHGCFGTESFVVEEPENVDAMVTGDCINGVFISIEDIPGAMYQWYLDGTLIPGAVLNPYQVPSDFPGVYHVVASNGIICTESNPLDVDIDLNVLGIGGDVVDLLCYGLPTGSINVVANDMNPPLTYAWSNGDDTQEITDLEAGTYTVTVIDANGCYGEMDFTVNTPTPFINSLTVVQPDMGNPGSAGVMSSGGTMPYTYAWNDGFDQATNNNLAAGSYSITVTDGNGCVEVFEFEIISNFVVIEMSDDETCSGACDGSILLTIDGSNSEYSVVWDDNSLSGFNPVEVCSGIYSYTVTDSEESPFVGTVMINSSPEIIISAEYEDTICANASNVDIFLSIVGGNQPYSYLWNTGSTNDTLFDVGAGSYYVEVTDFNGCVAADTFTIVSLPLIDLQFETNSTGCNGEEDGTIDLTIVNGVQPFDIIWSNDSISEDLMDLGEGWYFVTVTDFTGCGTTDSVRVNANSGIEVDDTVRPVNCRGDDDGSIALEISGGQMPYDILWSNNEEVANIENLLPGIYEVTIVDNNGCTWTQSYDVLLNSDISINAVTQDNLCFEGEEGSIELSISNANSSYTLQWQDGPMDENRYDLAAGSYSFELIDSFGCTYLDDYTISEGIEMTYQTIISEPGCNGAQDGFISISPVTGAFPFTYLWSNGDTLNQLNDLSADTYFLIVTDDNGCVKRDTFILSENSDVVVEESVTNNLCYGESEGAINLNITGGSEPYNILWSNGEETDWIENLPAGDYFVTVEDGNGCSSSYSYAVNDPDSLRIEDFVELPLCFGELGRIGVQGNGGAELYSFLWSTGETAQVIDVAPGTTYMVTMTDMNQCTKAKTYIIEDLTEVEIVTTSIVDPSSQYDDGSITIDISGGTPPYSVTWNNGQTGLMAIDLGAGLYTATAVDANGCAQMITVELTNDPLMAAGLVTDNLCFGDCEGLITLTIGGGAEPYTVNWSDGQDGVSASSLCNGDYQATIIDESGVEVITEMFTISSPSTIIIQGTAYDISCVETEDGAIVIDSDGGESPFDYNWSNTMVGDSIGNLSPGEYSVTVMDSNGCSESDTYTIDDIPLIVIAIETNPFDCDNPFGSIIINGDNPQNYPYFINGNPVVPDDQNEIGNLDPGTYRFSYGINETCVIEVDSFTIDEASDIDFELSDTELIIEEGEYVIISLNLSQESLMSISSLDWNMTNPFECIVLNQNDPCIEVSILAEESEDIALTIIDVNGCETILDARIIVQDRETEIHIPNIFSPNGDGINDEFSIHSNDENIIIQSMQIFDRWGNSVFLNSNSSLQNFISWNGELNGKKVTPNVYVYMIEVVDGKGKTQVLFGDLAVVY